MAKTKPEAGETYRLTGGVIGNGPGLIYPNQIVKVREYVPADVPGAHNSSEDAVVVGWDEDGPVMGEDGTITRGASRRAYAVGVGAFADQFTKEA